MKGSPESARGVGASARARATAVMPVREVKRREEKQSRDLWEKKGRRAAMVRGVGSTATVGMGTGTAARRCSRLASLVE